MTPGRASRIAVVALAGTAVVAYVQRIRAGERLTPAPALAAAAVAAGLALVAEASPEAAAATAGIVLAGALIGAGPDVLRVVRATKVPGYPTRPPEPVWPQ